MKSVKKFRAFLGGFILFLALDVHSGFCGCQSGGTEAE